PRGRGAALPDPRAQRERRPVGDRAPRAVGGAVPREVRRAMIEFTTADYAERMRRAVAEAERAGLTGVLITPGPDLVYFTAYQPTAITERLTVLVVQQGRDPALLVTILERPDAEAAVGVAATTISDWTDGTDPYDAAAPLLDPKGRYAISDSAWAMHLHGLQA